MLKPPYEYPKTYYVHDSKRRLWLAPDGTWTDLFTDACAFTTEEAAERSRWPGSEYDDCYVLAWNGIADDMRVEPIDDVGV